MENVVAIVGRPNVGKSTFFNRLVGERKAIMDNESGVTRDRHYGKSEWLGREFTVIDTGGYVVGSEDIFESEIRKQVKLAMDEATVILFMVDIADGLNDLDKEFANYVRRTKKPTYIIANKADTPDKTHYIADFYALGIGGDEIFPISSQTGSGTGDLLDQVISHFKDEPTIEDEKESAPKIPRIAIVGRPNVGKSSMLNVLLGTERSIVTDIAGTTRDAIDTRYKAFGLDIILTDTAGIRKKSVEKDDIEFYSSMRSINAIEKSDICICMLDAERGLESQDMSIIGLAVKYKKATIIAVNKWDLIDDKDSKTTKEWEDFIKKKLSPNDFLPVIFTSVVNKQRIHKVLEKAVEIFHNKTKKIPTSVLNERMQEAIAQYPPPAVSGRFVKIKYITQLPIRNPTFAFFCSNPRYVNEPYKRYLENKMREYFGYEGINITLVFRQK